MTTTASQLPTEETSLAPETAQAPVSDRRDVADLVTLASFALQAPVAVVGLRRPDGVWETVANGCQGGTESVLVPAYEAIAASGYPTELPNLALLPIGGSLDVIRWGYGVGLRDPEGTVTAVFAVFDRCHRQMGRPEQGAVRLVYRRLLHLLGLGSTVATAATGDARDRAEPVTSPANLAAPAAGAGAPSRILPALMKTRDVAALFNVTDRTVLNWAERGQLPCLRTAGGHLRFHGRDVQDLLNAAG